MLWRSRGFAATAVIVIAVGIGGSTAMFSVLDAVLLKPLDYPEPSRLVAISDRPAGPQAQPLSAGITGTGPAFLALRRSNRAFAQLAATATYGTDFNLTGGERPERVRAAAASSNYFEMLGVTPRLGRSFRLDEELPGRHVAVLTNRLWRARFGSDPDIVGHTLALDQTRYTIVGVLPASGSLDRGEAQLWTPIAIGPDELRRDNYFLNVYGRLHPGVTLAQASQDVQRVYVNGETTSDRSRTAVVEPMRNQLVNRDLRRTLWLLMGAVSLLLLIACANVANLLLARGVARIREVAIRQSLGATRSRLLRQFFTESLPLAASGGALGVVTSLGLLRGFLLVLPAALIPAEANVTIDRRTLAFAAGISLLTGMFFGMVPALRASRADSSLRREASAAPQGRRLQNVLLGAEVALMFVLLVSSVLLIRSFQQLLDQNPGFHAEHVLAMHTVLPEARYFGVPQILSYESEFLGRLEATPGVQAAAATSVLPLSGRNQMSALMIQGRREGGIGVRAVTSSYLETMGIPLLQGRFLSNADEAQNVTVVNDTLARRFWPDGGEIGRQIQIGQTSYTIVGVVADVRHKGLDATPTVEAYVPQATRSSSSLRHLTFLVRTTQDPELLARTVTREAADVDPEQPLFDVGPMENVVAESVAQPRFRTSLLGTFGGLALILVAAGIYGVVSYSVVRRTRELGIRMALGAQMMMLVGLVLRDAWAPVASGMVVGVIGCVALRRIISGFLFQIGPTDVATLVAIGFLVSIVTVAASLVPARRATQVDPLTAFRSE